MADRTYTPVPKSTDTKAGDEFRITFAMHGDYSIGTVQKIKDVLYGVAGLVDSPLSPARAVTGFWVIDNVDTSTEELAYDHVPTVKLGQPINFNVIVSATRTGSGTPLVEVIGPLLALLGLLIVGATVVGWSVEKLNKGPIGGAIGQIGGAVAEAFPALLLGAFVIGLLLVLHKGGKP